MSDNIYKEVNHDSEITLKEFILKSRDWLLYFRSKWVFISLVLFIGMAIGVAFATFQKPLYVASLTFALEDEKGSTGGLSGALGLASSLGFDLGTGAGGAFSGANLLELFKSRMVVEKALLNPFILNGRKITFAEMYIQIMGWRKNWEKQKINKDLIFNPGVDRTNFTRAQDSLLGEIYKKISNSNLLVFQKDKKVSIISVELKSFDQFFSKFFVEVLAKEVSDFYIETKSKKAFANVTILQKQADSVKAQLNNAITGVATSNDDSYNLNPAFNVNRTPSIKRQIDVQANTAIFTQLVANLELAKVTLRKETPLIQIIDKPILPLEIKKTRKLTALVIGGFLAGVICFGWLVLIRIYKRIFS